jgi:hypothetical protein
MTEEEKNRLVFPAMTSLYKSQLALRRLFYYSTGGDSRPAGAFSLFGGPASFSRQTTASFRLGNIRRSRPNCFFGSGHHPPSCAARKRRARGNKTTSAAGNCCCGRVTGRSVRPDKGNTPAENEFKCADGRAQTRIRGERQAYSLRPY